MTRLKPRIAVLGSINMDLVIRCQNLPRPGETLIADSAAEICGGKGANQAIAAARAGGEVAMIGRVGDDDFAARLLTNLQSDSVNCQSVQPAPDCSSGLAVVAVEQSGQNSIMVVPGANGRVSTNDVEAARGIIETSDTLLLQLEIPVASVLAAIEIARSANVRVILDPAPTPNDCPPELFKVDLMCPNESEASALTNQDIQCVDDAARAARILHEMGAQAVAVTLGENGTLLLDGAGPRLIEPFPVQAVDSTAAGDAFAGALAVNWSQCDSLDQAVRFANAAGGLATTRHGAQPAIASRSEIDTLLARKTIPTAWDQP